MENAAPFTPAKNSEPVSATFLLKRTLGIYFADICSAF
jgi:hypothetical protein